MRKILFFSFLLSSVSWAFCPTHLPCQIGSMCSCIVPANSAYARYFYIDISGLEKKPSPYTYRCIFKSHPTSPSLYLQQSTFPAGVTYQCSDPRFPAELIVNTHNMQSSTGEMSIKYLVSASDYPSEITVYCSGN